MENYLVFDSLEDADRAERIISKRMDIPKIQNGKFNISTRFAIPRKRLDGKWVFQEPDRKDYLEGVDKPYSIEPYQDD